MGKKIQNFDTLGSRYRKLFLLLALFIFSFFGKINSLSAQAVIDSVSNFSGYQISCFGGSDGWIAGNGTGGTPPYTFEWTKDGTFYANTATITGIDGGFYSLNVFNQDGSFLGNTGQFVEAPTELVSQTQILIPFSGNAVSCAGATDAKAFVYSYNGAVDNVTGIAPYVYTWSNGQMGDTLRNVGAGTYTVVTTDGNGCTYENTIMINDVPAKTININVDVPITCEGGSNGGLTALVTTGAIGSEAFSWSHGPTTNTVMGLSAGTYTVTINDDFGCVTVDSIILADGPEFTVNFGITPPACGANDGELVAIPTGGNLPYTSYSWSTGQTGTTISDLGEGVYTVTVFDALGCSTVATHELYNTNIFYTSIDSDDILNTSCPPSGGCTFSYNDPWFGCSDETVSTGEVFCINSGTFNCKLTLNGGTVYVAPGATLAPSNSNNYDGTIINCGTTVFSGQNFELNTEVHNYGEMTFPNISAKKTTFNNYIGANMYMNNSVKLEDASIINNDGNIEIDGNLTIEDGTINNNYNIFVNNTFIIQTNDAALNNFGRIAAQRDISINSGGVINNYCTLVALEDITIDNGFTNEGLLFANSSGSRIRINGAASFINNGEIVAQSLINNSNILGDGKFWVFGFSQQNGGSIGTDGNGINFYDASFDENGNGNLIFDVESGTINVSVTKDPPTAPLPTINTIPTSCSAEFNSTVCPGGMAETIGTRIFGGAAPYTYIWSTGATTPSISNVPPGTYTLTVTDVTLCAQVIEATVYTYDTIQVDSNLVQLDCAGTLASIDLTVSGGTAPYEFSWAHGPITEDLSNLTEGTYTVTITDFNSCIAIESFVIVPLICPEVCDDGIDNDGDGLVDCFDCDCFGSSSCDPSSDALVENLNDGIDNDCDGDIDCADADAILTDPVTFNFNGPPTITGFDDNVGLSARYPNVTTIGGTNIDIKGTVTSLSATGFASPTVSFVNSRISAEPGIAGAALGDKAEVTIEWELFEAGTNNLISSDLYFSFEDIDSISGNRVEFISVPTSDLQAFILANPTNVKTRNDGVNLEFTGTEDNTGSNPENGVSFLYNNRSSFSATYGITNYRSYGSTSGQMTIINSFILRPCREECFDGLDNDWDGNTDCDDSFCQSLLEENLNDGIDNDCDGDIDCLDADAVLTDPVTLNFNGAPTISGVDNTLGLSATYPNVTTIGGTSVDIKALVLKMLESLRFRELQVELLMKKQR